ncbi:MAG: lysozyme inhibitor LprI family protein [Cyanobacteria bacterium J06554_6]
MRVSTYQWLGCLAGLVAIATACNASKVPESSTEKDTEKSAEVVPETTPDAPTAAAPSNSPPTGPTDAVEIPEGSDPIPPTDQPSPVSAEKQDCGQLATQSEINACARANYEVSDRSLNQVYQTLRGRLSASDKAKLTTAEQAWIDFRDAQCDFERSRFEGGSIAPLILSSCLEQITDQRIAELRSQDGATESYEAADAQLNQSYQDLRAVMDEDVWPRFQAVQVDWLAYRDANCEYEATATLYSEEQCLARMTARRTEQLDVQREQWSL